MQTAPPTRERQVAVRILLASMINPLEEHGE